MTAIREALDTYPLGHLLRPGLGRMDLRPSLTKHLESELDDVSPQSAPEPSITQLVDELLELRGQWWTMAAQLPDTERAVILRECANALQHVLEGDR